MSGDSPVALDVLSPGAQAAAIQSLPTRAFDRQPSEQKAGEDAPSCAICMENFAFGEQLRKLPCRHEFHVACVDEWLKIRHTCPLCRHSINDPPVAENAGAANAAAAVERRPARSGSDSV
jgi:hypothetical protein